MVLVSVAPDPPLTQLLSRHPRVETIEAPGQEAALAWDDRQLFVGRADCRVKGLVELIDNNPLVCAQSASVPDPAGTLALIALGPLIRAGLIVDQPTMLTNGEADSESIGAFLDSFGWSGGLIVATENHDFGGVLAATVIVPIRTPERLEDVDDLYDEAYGRSFFVRREDEADWHVDLVRGRPIAAYRLRITPGEIDSLLTIQVMADRDGKCGAAQVVHAFNIMCGFEESLGIV